MGVLDRFEKGVERVVNNAFAKVGRSEVKPVELASALRREVDDRAAVVGPRPDRCAQRVHHRAVTRRLRPGRRLGGASRSPTSSRPTSPTHAATQHYAFVGPVSVTFDEHDDARDRPFPGALARACAGTSRRRRPSAPSARHPLVDIDGQRYLLTGPVTVIGRGSEADIVVDDPGVSRRHLEIRVTPDGGRRDATSAPPTDCSSRATRSRPRPCSTATRLTIGRTRIMFWTGVRRRRHEEW